mgnify:CR=1 FL=1
MALRNILQEGDDALRKTSREVSEINDRIKMILDDMKETMVEGNGVGLAAPQVGILRRMFVAMPDTEAESPEIMDFINPEIMETEGEQEGEEGCLSVPGYAGTVKRPAKLRIKFTDRDGREQIRDFEDHGAVVICHEYDHLDGILYTDKAYDVRAIGMPEDTEEEK